MGSTTRKIPMMAKSGSCGTYPCKPAPIIAPRISQTPYLLIAGYSILSLIEMHFAPLWAAWTSATTATASCGGISRSTMGVIIVERPNPAGTVSAAAINDEKATRIRTSTMVLMQAQTCHFFPTWSVAPVLHRQESFDRKEGVWIA